jgi:hypothetical protein
LAKQENKITPCYNTSHQTSLVAFVVSCYAVLLLLRLAALAWRWPE